MLNQTHEAPLSRCRVLVVEDEYFVADDVVRAIESLGAEIVGPVPTREQAMALLTSADRIDAAVLDVNLQGESVFPVADALAQRGIPFIFATGYDQSALPVAYQSIQRWEKPFDPTKLAQALPGLLA